MYKEAVRQKLRINTPKGNLGIEQLWDLSVTELDQIAVALDEQWKESGKKSYLKVKSAKDKKIKLMRDIVVDILETKVEEQENAASAQEKKAHNQKIEALIQKKKDESLENLSIEELEKQLK